MPLRALESLSFELTLRKEFCVRDGTAFQRLFSDIMKRRFGPMFHNVCPWGASGDWKNDGYLETDRQMFQCYAPRTMRAGPTRSKMNIDFSGAVQHWGVHFDEWVFVHNVLEGIPPFASAELLSLSTKSPPKRASAWGFEELLALVFELKRSDCVSILGPPLSEENFHNLQFKDIMPVLERVATSEPPDNAPVRPVPPAKLEANLLPKAAEEFLRVGMIRSHFVERCFTVFSDPTLGDRAAKAFKFRYTELRDEGLSPGRIFDELRIFAGGGSAAQTTDHDAAVLAVLAYFFETCDIFEAPLIHS